LLDRDELGLVNRLQQCDGLLAQLREPGAGEIKADRRETLVDAIQRLVVLIFIRQHAGQEADVGPATLDHARGRRRGHQPPALAQLDQRADVLEHHVGGGALGQAVGDLLPDALVGFVG
jgi:hypothetical protein